MVKQGDQVVGPYIEVLRELARRTDLSLAFVVCPQKRCLLQLERGEADLTIGLRRTPERERYLHFLRTPYRRISSDKLFYVRRGESERIRAYADLKGLRIGVKAGAVYFEPFDADAALTKEPAPDNTNNFRKLLLGRLDAVAMAQDQGEFLRESLGLRDRIEPARWRVSDPTPRMVAVARQSALMQRLPTLEAAMQAMQQDGSLARIYQEHYYRRYRLAPADVRIE